MLTKRAADWSQIKWNQTKAVTERFYNTVTQVCSEENIEDNVLFFLI